MKLILSGTYLNAPVYSFPLENVIAGVPAASAQNDRLPVGTSTIAAGNARVVQLHPNYVHIGRVNFVRSNGVPEYARIYFARYVTESRMTDRSDLRASRAQTRDVNIFQM